MSYFLFCLLLNNAIFFLPRNSKKKTQNNGSLHFLDLFVTLMFSKKKSYNRIKLSLFLFEP